MVLPSPAVLGSGSVVQQRSLVGAAANRSSQCRRDPGGSAYDQSSTPGNDRLFADALAVHPNGCSRTSAEGPERLQQRDLDAAESAGSRVKTRGTRLVVSSPWEAGSPREATMADITNTTVVHTVEVVRYVKREVIQLTDQSGTLVLV